MHILYTITLFYFQYTTVLTDEGDQCSLDSEENGKCVNIKDCPNATEMLKAGKYPQTCGFDGLFALVCCKEEARNGGATIQQAGALSLAKCKEYYPFPVEGVLVPGGEPSLAREFPHMAAIGFGEKDAIQWQCGGSLISKNFILTAAHCLYSRELGPAKYIRLGDLDFATSNDDAEPQEFSIKKSYPHPDYKMPSRYHDIALIELDKEVVLTDHVRISCLDTMRYHTEKQMIAVGWGKTEFLGGYSSFLLKVSLDLVPRNICQNSYDTTSVKELPRGIVDDGQICAGGNEGQDTCQGDSGGPLQIRNPEPGSGVYVYDIVGVTSFGKACGISRSPGVYTRVYNYLSWIESIVWKS